MASTALSASAIAAMVGNPNHDIFIRETVSLDVEINFPDDTLVNDPSDQDSFTHPYGWRAWVNPTQADLDADLKSPDNLWEPVFGEYTSVGALSTNYLQKIKDYQDAKLVLNSGTVIERFKSIWSDYTQLSDVFLTRIFDGQEASRLFAIESSEKTFDKSRVFVYINGILQPATNFALSKFQVFIASSVEIPVGAKIVVIYKKYQPTKDELNFDPETKDDYNVNTQYRFSYDHSILSTRDENGKIANTKYYFWVKNKNTPVPGSAMSVQQAKNLLVNGPSLYMTFHDICPATATLPVRYDAITLSGINKFVGKDDTYKIRFTRNFTLRDDPNELDLKNVHAEWTLIRPAQNVRIPLHLWEKMVDSACGQDIVGNKLPNQNLRDYDDRHGSTNRYGLGQGQVLADQEQVITSIKYTILNTQLTLNLGGNLVPDYIQVLNLSQLDKYFDTPENIRKTLDLVWREARPKQINEIFFAVINDALANNFEFKDIFKTSRLSIYSIKTVAQIITG